MHVDVALAHAQIRSVKLLFSAEAPLIVLTALGNVVRQRHGLQPLVAHGDFVNRFGKAGEKGIPVVLRVIDRHMHLCDGHGFRQRNHERLRKHGIGDAHMRHRIVDLPQRRQSQAIRRLFKRDIGLVELTHDFGHGQALPIQLAQAGAAKLAAIAFLQPLVMEKPVQKRGMRRVNAHFKRL